MAKIFIFSGTTEGRQLSEFLCWKKIENTVFVATEYGKVVMEPSEYCQIMQGRLDQPSMERIFSEERPELVIDATHPYAVEVSKNIKSACENAGVKDSYIRVARELPMTEQLLKEDYPDIEVVLSTEDAIEYLKTTQGNILLTTGVKTLNEYSSCADIKDRLVARILPSKESLNLAYDAGLDPHQIVAMEGPFLTSMNEAMIDQYFVKTLVTKNSGIKGGFLEKLEACKNKNVKALVIDIEKKREGISPEETQKILLAYINKKDKDEERIKTVTIVGIGEATKETVTIAAEEAIKKAQLIIGANRMLEYGRTINKKARCEMAYLAEDVKEKCLEAEETDIAFLVSGDSGFYSGAGKASEELSNAGIDVRLLPGISSVSYFSSLINVPYSGASLLSCHGRELDIEAALEDNNRFFSIVSGFEDVNEIIELAKDMNVTIYVGYNLGMPNHGIYKLERSSNRRFTNEGLYVVGVVKND